MILQGILLSILGYGVTLLFSRILGRKLISQMTFFDFVLGVAIGSAVVNAGMPNTSLSGFIVLIVIFILTLLLDFAHLKSFFFRKVLESEPVVVVENGKIVNQNMKKIRLTVEELMMMLREKNAFNIGDVEFAVLEFDGKLSVQPKSQKLPVTPSDLKLSTPYVGITRDIIIDGNIMAENLKAVRLDENWLQRQIRVNGIQEIRDVFYAGLDTSGNLYISKKRTGDESFGKHGIE
jgi:uncharacterized membrane protein YcaP (DUF421 family)